MNKVVQILMERDDMTKEEATELLHEVQDMMQECNYDPEECVEITASELGLEPDYITDILGY